MNRVSVGVICLAVALALALAAKAQAQDIGPPNTVACNKVFQGTVPTTLTQVVAALSGPNAGAAIYICGYAFNAGSAAGTAELETGTGTNCATGTTALTPAWALGVNGVFINRGSYAGEITPGGSALCWISTGTGPVVGTIYFSQF
jgi:hypothetical protein